MARPCLRWTLTTCRPSCDCSQGKYIVLRVVSRPFASIRSASFVGQTPEGGATMVQLGGPPFSLVSDDDELGVLLPVGSVIAIREPTLRQTAGASHSVSTVHRARALPPSFASLLGTA